jgi:predicted CopG family antitoxin
MPKYETIADRQEKFRLLKLERFERDTFSDFINALAEKGNLKPGFVLMLLHRVSNFGLVIDFKQSETGSMTMSVNKKYCGLTPMEVAWQLFLYQKPSMLDGMKGTEKFHSEVICECVQKLIQTSFCYGFKDWKGED